MGAIWNSKRNPSIVSVSPVDPVTGKLQVTDVRNSVLIHRDAAVPRVGAPTLKLSTSQLYAALTGESVAGLSANDQAVLQRFAGLFDGPASNFPIVSP